MKVLLLLLLPFAAFGQSSPELKNDTLKYQGRSFYVGQEVKLFYGSAPNKDFVFVFLGSGFSGVTAADARYAKSIVKVDKVYTQKGKFFIRGTIDGLALNKCFVNIEGAIDFKELVE